MRTGCHFCAESLPFYKHLGEMERSNALQAHLLAVMPDEKEFGAKYLKDAGVTVDAVFGQSPDSIKVSGTPTLMLIDSKGRVQHAWIGKQSPQGEQEIISAANASQGRDLPWYMPWRR